MLRFNLFVIFLALLCACGASPPTTDQAVATIGAGLNPAPAETPTPPPTAQELAQLKAVASRLTAMYRAAQALGNSQTAIGSDWQNKVHTQVTILLGAKGGIEKATIPERYQTPRLAEILGVCGVMAESLNRADLRRSDVIGIEGLERCTNGLREMEFIYTEYTK